jgi:nucleotide-binding universal stress UspA family protein
MEVVMNANSVKRILVPTDMSEFSSLALEYALLFQKKLGSAVTLLFVDEYSTIFAADYPLGYSYFQYASALKKQAQESLQLYAKEHVPETAQVTTRVVEDSPARAIVATADDIQADLIIMGTHGRHGLRRALLGSVTERVLRETDRPVMTVAPQTHPVVAAVKVGTILCPVNYTAVAHDALKQASTLAQAFGAELVVLHVSDHDAPRLDSIEGEFSESVDPRARARTRYQKVVLNGDPAELVLEVADQLAADLIVIGAQHKRFSDATVIGATTERIARFAKRPVLTVIRRKTTEQEAVNREPMAMAQLAR